MYQNLIELPKRAIVDSIPAGWNNAVVFRGDGSAKNGGAFRIRLNSGTRKRIVTITKETGEATISK